MKRIAILLLVFALPSASFAGRDYIGTTAAQFLKIGVGARPAGMGEAYGAVSDDANAIYWNPAGLAQLSRKELSLSYAMWLEKSNCSFLSYSHPLKTGTFAFAVNQLAFPPVDKYDNQGRLNDTYTAGDMALNLAYAGKVAENAFAGVNLKTIQSTIDGTPGSGSGLDCGFLYRRDNISFAAAVQNIGSSMLFVEKESPLPMNIKIGTALTFYTQNRNRLLVAFDVNAPLDDDLRLNLGTEYSKKLDGDIYLSGRFGVKSNTRGLDAMSALFLGLGICNPSFNFDLVFAPYGGLGDAIKVSIGLKFGSSAPAASITEKIEPEETEQIAKPATEKPANKTIKKKSESKK
jgi:hypothetical protein